MEGSFPGQAGGQGSHRTSVHHVHNSAGWAHCYWREGEAVRHRIFLSAQLLSPLCVFCFHYLSSTPEINSLCAVAVSLSILHNLPRWLSKWRTKGGYLRVTVARVMLNLFGIDRNTWISSYWLSSCHKWSFLHLLVLSNYRQSLLVEMLQVLRLPQETDLPRNRDFR